MQCWLSPQSMLYVCATHFIGACFFHHSSHYWLQFFYHSSDLLLCFFCFLIHLANYCVCNKSKNSSVPKSMSVNGCPQRESGSSILRRLLVWFDAIRYGLAVGKEDGTVDGCHHVIFQYSIWWEWKGYLKRKRKEHTMDSCWHDLMYGWVGEYGRGRVDEYHPAVVTKMKVWHGAISPKKLCIELNQVTGLLQVMQWWRQSWQNVVAVIDIMEKVMVLHQVWS